MMRLLHVDRLNTAMRRHADVRSWIERWVGIVGAADWHCLDDVRQTYPSADGVKLRGAVVVTVFNVRGNTYRLLTQVDYDRQVVAVLELLTHAEYDKQSWKGRY